MIFLITKNSIETVLNHWHLNNLSLIIGPQFYMAKTKNINIAPNNETIAPRPLATWKMPIPDQKINQVKPQTMLKSQIALASRLHLYSLPSVIWHIKLYKLKTSNASVNGKMIKKRNDVAKM